MLLQPISGAGAGARRSSAEGLSPPPPPPTSRLRRRVLCAIRADAPPPIHLSAVAPSRPAKPPVCTADELHHAPVSGAGWRLALWRYRPPPHAPARNHPLMLLSGVGTNAIGFDLSPGASFARHMSNQGFDTWIVEVRGSGLSIRDHGNSASSPSGAFDDISNGTLALDKSSTLEVASVRSSGFSGVDYDDLGIVALDDPPLLTEMASFFDRISKLLEEASLNKNFHEITDKISVLSEMVESSAVIGPMREESLRLLKNFQEQIDSWERFVATQMNLNSEYNWDFDHYLEEDIPTAVEYIRQHSGGKDGKLLAIGHSMGGILLYAMLSKYGFEGVPSNLAAIVTLASSVDYTTSNSSLKMLLPLVHPAQALNVPAVPLGTLLAAAYPWASGPPYLFSWLNHQISAQDMMHPELLSKLVQCLQRLSFNLQQLFGKGGFAIELKLSHTKIICDITPVLALAGDKDLICPPEAVYETVKLIPQHMVKYGVFGKPEGPHYAHYDLVGGRLATDEVYPCIIEFLSRHDQ
uniref:AB hydrolase-1 domain-containing protein n=1 Tax=Oryza meridionalis TaxID=40149 RepID=A0A0E0EKR2_9ORYZ